MKFYTYKICPFMTHSMYSIGGNPSIVGENIYSRARPKSKCDSLKPDKLDWSENTTKALVKLPTSIGNSVRFNWPHVSGESQQFIHTVTAKALILPLSTV